MTKSLEGPETVRFLRVSVTSPWRFTVSGSRIQESDIFNFTCDLNENHKVLTDAYMVSPLRCPIAVFRSQLISILDLDQKQ